MPKPKERYNPTERYWEKEYIEDGLVDGPSIWIKARTSLTQAELESISMEPEPDENGDLQPVPTDVAYERLAPFIVDWNLALPDDKGKLVDVPPPTEAGGEVLHRVHPNLVVRILFDIRKMVVRPVDPKSSSSPASTASP